MSDIDLTEATGAAARAAFRHHCGPDADLDRANASPPAKSFDAETGKFEEIPEDEREPYLTDLWEGWMRAGLAAAAPLIAAQVRAQIVAEIEALATEYRATCDRWQRILMAHEPHDFDADDVIRYGAYASAWASAARLAAGGNRP